MDLKIVAEDKDKMYRCKGEKEVVEYVRVSVSVEPVRC